MTLKENLEQMKAGDVVIITAENCMCENWDGHKQTLNGKEWTYKKIEGGQTESKFEVTCVA